MSPIRGWEHTRMSRHTPTPEPRPDWVEKQQHRPATRASPMVPRDRVDLSQSNTECFTHHTISKDSTAGSQASCNELLAELGKKQVSPWALGSNGLLRTFLSRHSLRGQSEWRDMPHSGHSRLSVDYKDQDQDGEMEDVDDEGNPIDPNEPRYCICNRVSFGTMIQCDNVDGCKEEWFHLQCVGLEEIPARTTKWYCPDCRRVLNIGERGEVSARGVRK
ncbi:unnamed protein product [Clonostachys rhizophaga]|uniref:PHD-type domain-containing protein n=1 Tax=Clonostachys rhizophaga TaxID=160324 RepID=A0A9N9VPH7_9HYPO|nr:unnamed protein product [Clonostachys rhizophaga]